MAPVLILLQSLAGGAAADDLSHHVATNAALAGTPTATYANGVWRDDYSAGFGASPLFYTPRTAACPLNGGAGVAAPRCRARMANAGSRPWARRSMLASGASPIRLQ